MTAASPVPVHPRLGVRLAYRLQRVLRPNAGYRWLAARIEGRAPELRNGPCGGVGADGSCEVYPDRRCVWLNHRLGRDDNLWTADTGANQ